MNMLSKTEFELPIWNEVNKRPSFIRRGQAVFNATEEIYGVAREVQFKDKIDCFYDDSQIEAFLKAAYKRLVEHENEKNAQTCVGTPTDNINHYQK